MVWSVGLSSRQSQAKSGLVTSIRSDGLRIVDWAAVAWCGHFTTQLIPAQGAGWSKNPEKFVRLIRWAEYLTESLRGRPFLGVRNS